MVLQDRDPTRCNGQRLDYPALSSTTWLSLSLVWTSLVKSSEVRSRFCWKKKRIRLIDHLFLYPIDI